MAKLIRQQTPSAVLGSLKSPPYLIFLGLLVTILLIHRVVYRLTTRAARKRLIRENGCQQPYKYPHKGILGKLFGWDVIPEIIRSAKTGHMLETSRIRNFSHGNTISIKMFAQTMFITIEPENVKTILSIKFQDYVMPKARTDHLVPVFGHGIFANDGAAWERSRALVRPNFARQQVADLDMLETHVQHLIDAVPKDGGTVDLQPLFFALTMDSATEFLFGRSTNTLSPGQETEGAHEFIEAYIYGTETVALRIRSGGLAKYIPNRKFRKSIKTMNNFADGLIQQAIQEQRDAKTNFRDDEKEGSKKRYVFLYELLQQTQDPTALRSELLNILLAGRDTTAGLLSNTWLTISRRPDVWAKILAEVDALGGARPDYSQIKEMKYLRHVLNETLRLMPVVPGNGRQAVRDTILPAGGGLDGKSPLFVPKGTTVLYSPWSMHRREDYYGKDALEFRPERWETLRPGWEYLPFNGGPRICLGQQYALLEASYATVRLMQQFPRIESRDNSEWREWMTITLASGIGTKVALFEK